MQLFNSILKRFAEKRDNEWKEAIQYGYEHFKGKELDDFLALVDKIDDEKHGDIPSRAVKHLPVPQTPPHSHSLSTK